MKRSMMLLVALVLAVSPWACGQDDPPARPLAGVVVHTDSAGASADSTALRSALQGLRRVDALDEPRAVAAIVRVLLETAATPGARVALLDVAGDDQGVATLLVVASVPEAEPRKVVDGGADLTMTPRGPAGIVRNWASDGRRYFAYQHDPDAPFDSETFSRRLDALEGAFADHRPDATDGMELMLDLENLRRAWPQSLADGPARRVVAVTGLANARKIHVHLPERGPARIAYSSRALPAGEVSTRSGPTPAEGGRVGVSWPVMFDAGLRVYAVALDDEPRQAFGVRFQDWMGVHGNRLRGIIQSLDAGLGWSVTPADDGLRTSFEIPVRRGIETVRLLEAFKAALAGSGFRVEGDGGTLELPETVAAALGGRVLGITLERGEGEGGAARFVLTVDGK